MFRVVESTIAWKKDTLKQGLAVGRGKDESICIDLEAEALSSPKISMQYLIGLIFKFALSPSKG